MEKEEMEVIINEMLICFINGRYILNSDFLQDYLHDINSEEDINNFDFSDYFYCEHSESILDDSQYYYCEDSQEHFNPDTTDYFYIDQGGYYSTYLDNYVYIDYGIFRDTYVHEEDAIYCENSGWYHVDSIDNYIFLHSDGNYYECEEEEETNENIYNYHRSPSPTVVNGLAKNYGYFGIEVEKCEIDSDTNFEDIGESNLFKGIEEDSSCGFEAITNIIAVNYKTEKFLKSEILKQKVLLNSEVNSCCSGHITLSIDGLSGLQLQEKIRPYLSLWFALFKGRLKNNYCSGNIEAKNERTDKYSAINVFNNRIEIRIPSKIGSKKVFENRCNLAILTLMAINKNLPYSIFLLNCKALLNLMYNGNQTKINEVKILSLHFRKYLASGIPSNKITNFLP
jgi:hypothetical protein